MINRNRRGSYYATVALALPVLIGFTAMGVDWGSIAVARNQVQTAADSAALAAVSSMDNRGVGRTRAAAYAAAVQVNGKAAVVHASDVEYGFWSGTTFYVDADGDNKVNVGGTDKTVNCAKATASVDIELPFTSTFRKLLGDNQAGTLTVRQVAGASPNATPGRAPDTVLVLDVTQSMQGPGEYDAESMAAQELVTCVKTKSTGSSRAAVTKFTNVDRLGIVLSDYATYYDDLMQATSRSAVAVHGIYGIAGCDNGNDPDCSGYTNQSAGLAGARYILEEAVTPADVEQAVVLFSDGQPYTGSGTKACDPANFTAAGIMWNQVTSPNLQDRCYSMTERECSVRSGTGHTTGHNTQAGCEGHGSCSNSKYTTEATCAPTGTCSDSSITFAAACTSNGRCRSSTGSYLTGTKVDTQGECEALGRCSGGTSSGAHSGHRNKDQITSAVCSTGTHSPAHTWTRHTWQTNVWTASTSGNVWTPHTWRPPISVPDDSSGAFGFPHYLTDWAYDEKALLLANGAARVAAGKGKLTIYTVYYSETPSANEIAFMESLATDPSKAYDVSDLTRIPGVFHEICEATQTGDPGLLF